MNHILTSLDCLPERPCTLSIDLDGENSCGQITPDTVTRPCLFFMLTLEVDHKFHHKNFYRREPVLKAEVT